MWKRLTKEVTTEPIQCGTQTLRGVARLDGWQFVIGNKASQSQGAFLRMVPVAFFVDKDGSQQRVPCVDPAWQINRRPGLIGLSVSVVCWLLMWLTTTWSRRG